MEETESWGLFDQVASDNQQAVHERLARRRVATAWLTLALASGLVMGVVLIARHFFPFVVHDKHLADHLSTESARLAGINYHGGDFSDPLYITPGLPASPDRTDRIVALQTLAEKYSSDASDNLAWMIFVLSILVGTLFGVVVSAVKYYRKADREYWQQPGVRTAAEIRKRRRVDRRESKKELAERRQMYERIALREISPDEALLFLRKDRGEPSQAEPASARRQHGG